MVIHAALVIHIHNSKMRSSLACCFNTCEVPTCDKIRNITISYSCNFAKLNRGISTSLTIRPKSSLQAIIERNILLKSPKSKLSYTNKYCSRSWQEDIQPNLFQMAVMDGCVLLFIWFPRQWCPAFTGHHLKCFGLQTSTTGMCTARQVFWWAYSLLGCHSCKKEAALLGLSFLENACLNLDKLMAQDSRSLQVMQSPVLCNLLIAEICQRGERQRKDISQTTVTENVAVSIVLLCKTHGALHRGIKQMSIDQGLRE